MGQEKEKEQAAAIEYGTIILQCSSSSFADVVHRLLKIYSSLQAILLEKFSAKNPGLSGENWTREELQEFLFEVTDRREHMRLCLFIDALDEAEYEDVRHMVQFRHHKEADGLWRAADDYKRYSLSITRACIKSARR